MSTTAVLLTDLCAPAACTLLSSPLLKLGLGEAGPCDVGGGAAEVSGGGGGAAEVSCGTEGGASVVRCGEGGAAVVRGGTRAVVRGGGGGADVTGGGGADVSGGGGGGAAVVQVAGSGQAPQSATQERHVSTPLQRPSPQLGHAPQSPAHVVHVSLPSQRPLPQSPALTTNVSVGQQSAHERCVCEWHTSPVSQRRLPGVCGRGSGTTHFSHTQGTAA